MPVESKVTQELHAMDPTNPARRAGAQGNTRKAQRVLSLLRDAAKAASLVNAEFGSVCRAQKGVRDRPVTMADGSPVTELNLTDFIRERVKGHHDTWVIGYIQMAMQEVQSTIQHKFEPERFSNGSPGFCCMHCDKPESHRSHTK